MVFPGANFGEARPGRMEETTVPLDMRNDIREMEAAGVSRSEIAGKLRLSRNAVAKYADMEDMSPAAPVVAERQHPAIDAYAEAIGSMLASDLGAPRRQRHTARRIYDRIVEEHGCRGSHSSVQRCVRAWRRARATGTGDGCLELGWAPGAARVDFGNFEAGIAGERTRLRLLVLALPHSSARHAAARRPQGSECMCAALSEIFGWIGRAPSVPVLDNACV